MRKTLILSLIFIIIILSGCQRDARFSTPENTITTLENEYNKENYDFYLQRTYFSDWLVKYLYEMGCMTLDEYQQDFKQKAEEAPKHNISHFDFTNKTVIDKNHVYLEYTMHYLPEDESYTPEPRKDKTYFIKKNKEWFIDIEPELRNSDGFSVYLLDYRESKSRCYTDENKRKISLNKLSFDKSNKCMVLAYNLASNFDKYDNFLGEVRKDLEMGGILIDYKENRLYFKALNYPSTIFTITPQFKYSRGKFYSFNSKNIKLGEYGEGIIESLTEIKECNNNKEYVEYIKSQPEYRKDYFCEEDSDCVVRTNNYAKTRAYHKYDPVGIGWEATIETGPPGHTTFPNSEDVIAICDNGKCFVKFNCSKCEILKENIRYSHCENYTGGTSGWMCRLYSECEC